MAMQSTPNWVTLVLKQVWRLKIFISFNFNFDQKSQVWSAHSANNVFHNYLQDVQVEGSNRVIHSNTHSMEVIMVEDTNHQNALE